MEGREEEEEYVVNAIKIPIGIQIMQPNKATPQ